MIIAYDLPTSCAKRGGCWSESDLGWYPTPRRHLGCIPFPRKCQSELSEGCPCQLKHWSVHLSGSHGVQVVIKLFLGGLQWHLKTRDFTLELPDYEFQCGVVSRWPCVLPWWLGTIAKMIVNWLSKWQEAMLLWWTWPRLRLNFSLHRHRYTHHQLQHLPSVWCLPCLVKILTLYYSPKLTVLVLGWISHISSFVDIKQIESSQ